MSRPFVSLSVLALSLSASMGHTSISQKFSPGVDVAVYGGTAAGAIAAIAAANAGLDAILLEPRRHVGGMVSGGLGRTDYANQKVIGGMSRAFFERVGQHYGEPISWFFEPHVAESVFRDWLEEAGVSVYFGRRLSAVRMEGARIESVEMENGAVLTADVFVDASYEGDLMARAGVSYTWGREGQDVYGESLAGRIAHSPKHQFSAAVDPYDAKGNLLPLIYTGDPGRPGEGDKKVQAYNFRICLCSRKDNQVPFPRPQGYDPKRYELLRRYLEQTPGLKMNDVMIVSPMPNDKTDVNNRGPISTDYIGGSWAYPEASYERREEIWEEHVRYVQGFFYFLANDPSVPRRLQAEVNGWGLAKDEFADTGHWPHQLYIREARRMVGEYVMHQADLQTERTKPDSIGMGSYNSDSHHVQRIPVAPGERWPEAGVVNEGDMQVPVKPYEIAYRALVPKRAECTNLLVPACVSASHVAYSSIRMEPQYMIMGHAAGVAAAQAITKGVAVQDIDTGELRARLRAQKQVLSLEDAGIQELDPRKLPGIVVDNADAETRGNWRTSTSVHPYAGEDYLHEDNKGQGNASVRFVPDLPKTGRYELRIAYTAHPNRATNVPVTVNTAEGLVTLTLNQRKALGPNAPFLSVGKYAFGAKGAGYVELGTEGAGGYVVADAVQWIPED